MIQKISSLFSKKYLKLYIIAAIILIAAFSYFKFRNGGGSIAPVAVARGTITQEVEVSGKTKPVSSADLSFEIGGKIVSVPAVIGAEVKTGDLLVALDRSGLFARQSQASANLMSEQAVLAEMQKGTRLEEIGVYSAKLDSAVSSLTDTKSLFADKIKDAYLKADDSVKNYADQFFDKFSITYSFKSEFVRTTDPAETNKINAKRYALISMFADWNSKIKNIDENTDLKNLSDISQKNLAQVKDFLDLLADVINTNQAAGYRADVSLARTNVNAAVSNLTSAELSYSSAKSAVDVASKDLKLKEAGSSDEQIKAETARVAQYQAALQSVNADLSKAVIVSPIDGVITKQEAKAGEMAMPGVVIVSVISKNNLEIEGYVPEVNVGKIEIGNDVEVTFDAIVGEKFKGKLAYVEPAETMIDGVVNYKIKVTMDGSEDRLKSGMTANLKIITAAKENSLYVPRVAIYERDGKNYVKKLKNKDSSGWEEKEVVAGLYGYNGVVEIVSGISEGDYVLVND